MKSFTEELNVCLMIITKLDWNRYVSLLVICVHAISASVVVVDIFKTNLILCRSAEYQFVYRQLLAVFLLTLQCDVSCYLVCVSRLVPDVLRSSSFDRASPSQTLVVLFNNKDWKLRYLVSSCGLYTHSFTTLSSSNPYLWYSVFMSKWNSVSSAMKYSVRYIFIIQSLKQKLIRPTNTNMPIYVYALPIQWKSWQIEFVQNRMINF